MKKIVKILLSICFCFLYTGSVLATDMLSGTSTSPISAKLESGNMIAPLSYLKDITIDDGTTVRLSSIFTANDTLKVIEYEEGIKDLASYENVHGDVSYGYGSVFINNEINSAKKYKWQIDNGESSFSELSFETKAATISEITREDNGKTIRCLISTTVPAADTKGTETDYEDIMILDRQLEVLWLPSINSVSITADGKEIY